MKNIKSKFWVTSILLFSISILNAQEIQFEEVVPASQTPYIIDFFEGVSNGSTAFADIDGDNDLDVLISGFSLINDEITRLYQNDGSGGYTEVSGTPFTGVQYGSIAFADIDGDNDQDVLITGYDGSVPIAKLYANNGNGVFSLVTETPFEGVDRSSIAFADIDGDSDQDVLITGSNIGNSSVSKLYINDGNGNYSLNSNTPIEDISFGSVAFADIDGDNDQDVFISGFNGSIAISELYTNDGNGNYSLVTGAVIEGVYNSSSAFADIDGDNDQDLLISGRNGTDTFSNLYRNNGSGNFSLVSEAPFELAFVGSIDFTDIDGDNDQDVFISGFNGSIAISELYTNDGNGNYSLVTEAIMEGVYLSSSAFADIDGDNDQDLLITGSNDRTGRRTSKLYSNDGSGEFSLVTLSPPFEGVRRSSMAFIDIDGDNDQDVLISGENNFSEKISRLYINNGTGEYSQVLDMPFKGVYGKDAITFADVDGDNDQDILLLGNNGSDDVMELYINNGFNNGFSLVENSSFIPVSVGSVAFTDYDEDNDLDLFVTGREFFNVNGIKLYVYSNDGNGVFSLLTSTINDAVSNGSLVFADIDGDNDEDFFLTGQSNSNNIWIFNVFINNGVNSGTFNFTYGSSAPFIPVTGSSIAFSDIDDDNDLDVLIIGVNESRQRIANLYKNDGTGSFILVNNTPFEGVIGGSINFVDIDNDNDEDVFISGDNGSTLISKLYTNDGSGNFSLVTGMPFEGLSNGSSAFADIDGDNDQDLIISGENNVELNTLFIYNQGNVKLYRNISEITLGIEDLDQLGFSVYPNPVKDVITIDAKGTIENITIYNIMGQKVNSSEAIINNEIDVSNFSKGLYIMNAEINGTTQSIKFLKE